MADKRITELQPLDAAGAQAAVDVLAVADVSAAETKKITLGDAVAAGLAGGVPDGSIPGSKIEVDSLPGDRLLDNSVTSRALAPNSVNTIHVIDGAVTNAKLAGEISGDKIQSDAIGSNHLADNSVNSNHIIDGAVDNVHLASGIDGAKLRNDSVTNVKLASGINGAKLLNRSVSNTAIEQNSLTAKEIAPNAIGASELNDGAVDTAAIKNDAISTIKLQSASVTDEKLASGINGDKIIDGTINANKIEPGTIDGNQINEVPLNKLPDAPVNTVVAGPTSGGAKPPTYRKLVSNDLPVATDANKGAVSVPAVGGLAVDSLGAIAIGNTVAPSEQPVVTYNSHGLITGGRGLKPDDLPVSDGSSAGTVKPGDGLAIRPDGTLDVIPATSGEIGGVIEGDGITITGDGKISQSLTGVVAGEYTKFTCDAMGNITAGTQLEATDIPNIDWQQVENPSIDSSMLGDKSVQRRHLSDYSISFIQEVSPTIDSTVHVGCFWFKESTASLSQWNGNSWMSVGMGRLSAENLRYCGIFNASTGFITGLTQFGVAEGLEIGSALPTATDDLTGVYFVEQVAGNGTAVLPGQDLDAGDWALCNGAAAGWVRIDTLSSGGGGGGGGGAMLLDDLMDVTVASASSGAFLQLQSDGQWKDILAIDAGSY